MLSASLNQPVAAKPMSPLSWNDMLAAFAVSTFFQTASSIDGLAANGFTLRFAEPSFNFGE